MLAANLAVTCEMSVDDVEDVRMAAEEGFVYACATSPEVVEVSFTVRPGALGMSFALGDGSSDEEDELAWTYADLILSAVCDSYQIDEDGNALVLEKLSDGQHVE